MSNPIKIQKFNVIESRRIIATDSEKVNPIKRIQGASNNPNKFDEFADYGHKGKKTDNIVKKNEKTPDGKGQFIDFKI